MIARIITAAAASLTLAMTTPPALAQNAQSDTLIRKQSEVRIGDLDLSTPHGQRQLDRRVAKAARSVCRIPAPVGSRIERIDDKCYAEAVRSVQPRVAALIEQKSNHE